MNERLDDTVPMLLIKYIHLCNKVFDGECLDFIACLFYVKQIHVWPLTSMLTMIRLCLKNVYVFQA